MNGILRTFAVLLAALLLAPLAGAAPVPEELEGVIAKLSPKLLTIQSGQGAKVCNIEKAGVCGWPTRKKVTEVFKVGDKVKVYHFDDINSRKPIAVLNVFFADEAKTRAFQQSEPSQGKAPGKR